MLDAPTILLSGWIGSVVGSAQWLDRPNGWIGPWPPQVRPSQDPKSIYKAECRR